MTRRTLTDMHYTKVQDLASELGLEYTNKQDTINSILEFQENDITDAHIRSENLILATFLKFHVLGAKGETKKLDRDTYFSLKTNKIVK